MYVLSVGLGHSQQEKKTLDGVSHRKMSQGPVRMLQGPGGRLLCRQFS